MGIGDWGLGIGDWGLGPIPNPPSPIPNPQSPFYLIIFIFLNFEFQILLNEIFNDNKFFIYKKNETITNFI